MDPRLLAFEAARRQFVDGDATAAARDLAHAFGAVHPEAGTLRAIHAVIDQLDNPATTRLRSPAPGTCREARRLARHVQQVEEEAAAFVVEEADAAFVKK
jgi:hypothetical protein